MTSDEEQTQRTPPPRTPSPPSAHEAPRSPPITPPSPKTPPSRRSTPSPPPTPRQPPASSRPGPPETPRIRPQDFARRDVLDPPPELPRAPPSPRPQPMRFHHEGLDDDTDSLTHRSAPPIPRSHPRQLLPKPPPGSPTPPASTPPSPHPQPQQLPVDPIIFSDNPPPTARPSQRTRIIRSPRRQIPRSESFMPTPSPLGATPPMVPSPTPEPAIDIPITPPDGPYSPLLSPYSPLDKSTQPSVASPLRRSIWITYLGCGHTTRILLPAQASDKENMPPPPLPSTTRDTAISPPQRPQSPRRGDAGQNGSPLTNGSPVSAKSKEKEPERGSRGSTPGPKPSESRAMSHGPLPYSNEGDESRRNEICSVNGKRKRNDKGNRREDAGSRQYRDHKCQSCTAVAAMKKELEIRDQFRGRMLSLETYIQGIYPGQYPGQPVRSAGGHAQLFDARAVKIEELREMKGLRGWQITKAWAEYERLFGPRPVAKEQSPEDELLNETDRDTSGEPAEAEDDNAGSPMSLETETDDPQSPSYSLDSNGDEGAEGDDEDDGDETHKTNGGDEGMDEMDLDHSDLPENPRFFDEHGENDCSIDTIRNTANSMLNTEEARKRKRQQEVAEEAQAGDGNGSDEASPEHKRRHQADPGDAETSNGNGSAEVVKRRREKGGEEGAETNNGNGSEESLPSEREHK